MFRIGCFICIIAWGLQANASPPNEKVYATIDQAIDQIFPNSNVSTINIRLTPSQITAIESSLMSEIPTSNIIIYQFNQQNKRVGYGMVTHQIGKYEPITFFVGVNPEFQIEGVVVMVYREGYGQDVRKKRFLRQFIGKNMHNPLRVNHDITSISGATMSSYAIANGAKRALRIFHETILN